MNERCNDCIINLMEEAAVAEEKMSVRIHMLHSKMLRVSARSQTPVGRLQL